jgi:alpha-1,3-glucosyltransferase
MSITVSKPIADWYFEPAPREDIWWRIDYPPVAAYLSYVFGSICKYIEPQAMMLQQGY